MEELGDLRLHALQASLHTNICMPYLTAFATEEQKQRQAQDRFSAAEREGQATSAVTVEYWVNIMDVHLSQQPVFAYSVYSVAGRYDQGGAPYENANELVVFDALGASDLSSCWQYLS